MRAYKAHVPARYVFLLIASIEWFCEAVMIKRIELSKFDNFLYFSL